MPGELAASSLPSPELPSGEVALDGLLGEARSVRAAVAFVSCAGVNLLGGLLARHPHIKTISIVARGAPVSEPKALLMLRDQVKANVAVIAGPEASRFHPKLWLFQGDSGLWVLSGSGNLTEGGLRRNREQFEITHVRDEAAIDAQEKRFDDLAEGAIGLDEFEGSIAWKTWLEQLDRRDKIKRQLDGLDREIADSHPIDREPHKQELMGDLWAIYSRTLDAKLKKEDGSPYVPGGLRLQLEGKRGSKEPVPIVKSLCRGGTDGFDTILRANRPDLTVEWLVVDESKSYHTLFPEEIRRLSAERLKRFPRPAREMGSSGAGDDDQDEGDV